MSTLQTCFLFESNSYLEQLQLCIEVTDIASSIFGHVLPLHQVLVAILMMVFTSDYFFANFAKKLPVFGAKLQCSFVNLATKINCINILILTLPKVHYKCAFSFYFAMQRHRVRAPQQESLRSVVRQSAAFFVHPNDDCLIECLDGSNTYPPITSLEYLNQRFAATY